MATGFNPSRGPAETAVTTLEDDYRASLQPLVGSCWNETFAPLREAAEPLVDNSDVVPYEILHEMGTLLHPWGRKYVHRSVFIDELTDDLHEFILERTKAAPGRMDGIGIWPMGEAVGSGNSSAFAWSDKAHLIVIEAAWESHDNRAHIEWATETETDSGGLFGGGSWDAIKAAKLTHDEINARRMQEELQPVTWNKRLHQIAQNYAGRMVEEDFFSHTDPETGGDFEDRYANAGFECRVPIPDDSNRYVVGSENILKTYWYQEVDTDEGTVMYTTPEELATGITNSWMGSTGHRENILKPYWRSEGIGVAKTEEDTVYVVQNFC